MFKRRNVPLLLMTGLLLLLIALMGVNVTAVYIEGQNSAPLLLKGSVNLPGYSGDFDHFAVDQARGRLLLAAEDHGTVEVFDLNSGKHLQTIKGFEAPHSILIRPGAATILVTDSGKGMSKLLDASTYEVKDVVSLVPGADSIGYDPKENVVYIVTGGKDVDMATSELAAVDPDTGKKKRSVTLQDNHVEAMALEQNGNRLFINLTQTNKLAVIDRSTMKVIGLWPVPAAEQNAMVAMDEPHHRLFVGCRKPGMVVVMNSDTGAVTNSVPSPLRSDQILFDQTANRLYSPGGEGNVALYDTSDPDHLKTIAKVPTAPGAKTGILVPELKELILAASPGDTKTMAKVLTFAVQ
jgi:DNA-binding beta-propeller fold protein YncE